MATLHDMTRERAGGTALIVSAAAFIITMAFHPTGRELLAPGQFAHVMPIGVAVHALALVCLPVAFFGALVLSQRLDALGAIVTYGFGVVAIMIAAVCSGLVATAAASQIPAGGDIWRVLFTYTGMLNQAFALVYAIASSVAIVLWSVALLRHAKALGIAGAILGPLIVIVVLTHTIGLGVHGFGAIVLAEGAWFIACGIWLIRLKR